MTVRVPFSVLLAEARYHAPCGSNGCAKCDGVGFCPGCGEPKASTYVESPLTAEDRKRLRVRRLMCRSCGRHDQKRPQAAPEASS